MVKALRDRIGNPALSKRVVAAEVAVRAVESGMTIGTAGGYQFGYPRAFFNALVAEKKNDTGFGIDLWTGGPVGEEIDGLLAQHGILRKRLGQQNNAALRKRINERSVLFSDMRSGIFPHQVRSGSLGRVDLAVIEAVGITKEGHIIPTTGLFDGPTYVQMAEKIIVEINASYPLQLEGIHDVYLLKNPPDRVIIPIEHPWDRIGTPYIPVDSDKISFIIEGAIPDRESPPSRADETTRKIGKNLVDFFREEVDKSRLPANLLPLQLGLGGVADVVARELASSDFRDLTIFTGGIGDGVLDLIDSGRIKAVSTAGLYFSTEGQKRFFANLKEYKDVFVLRPLDIADSPEVIQRLGVIAINTAVEVDIYGHVNSSHVLGSKIISGVGGSGEFAQNGFLSIFITPSTGRGGSISAIVPMASHIDHSEHTVDIVVTEQGAADLRGLEPVERANCIIRQCAHPDYKPLLSRYLKRALALNGGHEPHLLEESFSFHLRLAEKETMLG